jgi:DNA-binding protein HU-beta
MNKTDLINHIADSVDLTKASAQRAVDGILQAIADTLTKGDQVAIPGFGTFSVGDRAARTGRNPQTGETIQIAAAKVVKFKAGKQLKDAVNED